MEAARREVVAMLNKGSETPEALAETWLNQVSYGVGAADELRVVSAATPADVQRAATRMFKNAPVAAVAVGDATQLRAELARAGEVEVLGASVPTPSPVQPSVKPTPKPAPITIPVRRPS
jgi:hypothetical protein